MKRELDIEANAVTLSSLLYCCGGIYNNWRRPECSWFPPTLPPPRPITSSPFSHSLLRKRLRSFYYYTLKQLYTLTQATSITYVCIYIAVCVGYNNKKCVLVSTIKHGKCNVTDNVVTLSQPIPTLFNCIYIFSHISVRNRKSRDIIYSLTSLCFSLFAFLANKNSLNCHWTLLHIN